MFRRIDRSETGPYKRNSMEMFEDLWEDWFDIQLIMFAKSLLMMELDY